MVVQALTIALFMNLSTATTPTTKSLFICLYKELGATPKPLDRIIKHKNMTDIGFGGVSFTKEAGKYHRDLCRLAIWSKRALGHSVAKNTDMEDLDICFLPDCVVEQQCPQNMMHEDGMWCDRIGEAGDCSGPRRAACF